MIACRSLYTREILACDDPVLAYVEMDAMLGQLLTANRASTTAVRDHLNLIEPAIRRARVAALTSWRAVRDDQVDTETRAHALADCYKRTVEGPFRQFTWALYCLRRGQWESPPTLGPLRDRVVAAGGALGALTSDVVIPEIRNAEAHETLSWDSFADQFLTGSVQVPPQRVVASTQLALSFAAGCEAGLAAVRFLDLPVDVPSLPGPDEQGRMPAWRRVQAFFGTNRLLLEEARLNSRHASLRVRELQLEDVNPCLQALVLSHRLMPDIQSFSVEVDDAGPTVIVAAEALDACMSSWEFAVSNLDQIPLSTFLAANLDARRHQESDSVAIRSVAWIAVDDAVGIIDGSPERWSGEDRALTDARLHVVDLAIQGILTWLGQPAPRLESVIKSVASLRQWVRSSSPSDVRLADRRPDMVRLRTQWESWGPVLRRPMVTESRDRDRNERQPGLRQVPTSMAFRSL